MLIIAAPAPPWTIPYCTNAAGFIPNVITTSMVLPWDFPYCNNGIRGQTMGIILIGIIWSYHGTENYSYRNNQIWSYHGRYTPEGMVRAWIILKGITIEPWLAMDYPERNNGPAMACAMAPGIVVRPWKGILPNRKGAMARHGGASHSRTRTISKIWSRHGSAGPEPRGSPRHTADSRKGKRPEGLSQRGKEGGRPVGRMGWIAM